MGIVKKNKLNLLKKKIINFFTPKRKKIGRKIIIITLSCLAITLILLNTISYFLSDTKELGGRVKKAPDGSIQKIENFEIDPLNSYGFELTIKGSTGYAPINLNVKEKPNNESNTLITLAPGTGFRILDEKDGWLYITLVYADVKGYVNSTYAMINLPDVIPSIIYDNTNSYSSLFSSSGLEIPNVTGKQLYNTHSYNKRLEKYTFNMVAMYNFAKKIAISQHNALKEGNSLKIYEAYRPAEVQRTVGNNLINLAYKNTTINNNLLRGGWNYAWFINTGLSNHQIGIAMDTSLVKINTWEYKKIGKEKYIETTTYNEYQMSSRMHELSVQSTLFNYPVNSESKTAWQNIQYASHVTNGTRLLQRYCTNAGLTPLASEWWHFNDLDTKWSMDNNYSDGEFFITGSYSIKGEDI